MSNTSIASPKTGGIAPPNDFDPESLGPRQVAGWAVPFNIQREQRSHTDSDYRYRETMLPTCFDDDLRERSAVRPLLFEHAFGGPDRPIETVPIGRTVELQPYDCGLWCVAELNDEALPNATLAACRSGTIGFSIRASDLEPDIDHGETGDLPAVTRRKLTLREVSLTADPAWAPETMITFVGGRSVTHGKGEDVTAESAQDAYDRWLAECARDRDIKVAQVKLTEAASCRDRAKELVRARGSQFNINCMIAESELTEWAATLDREALPVLRSASVDINLPSRATTDHEWNSATSWTTTHCGWLEEELQLGRRPR
jgi:HK97 family phage prohead protease